MMPKLSASVNASLARPLHCLEIFPTWFWPSAVSTLQVEKHRHAKRARVIFLCDRGIRRTVYSHDLVKLFGCDVQH